MNAPYFIRRTLTPALLLVALLIGSSAAHAQIAVSLPDASDEVGNPITVALTSGDLTAGGADVFSYNFTVSFDPSIIAVTGIDASGTLSEGALTEANTNVAGQISVGVAVTTPLTGSGTLLVLEVDLLAGGNTALTFDDFTFNDGTPGATTANGSVTVTVPNQAPEANDDTDATDEDTAVVIDVLGNDTDPDGSLDPSSVTVTSGPTNGGTSVNTTTGAITYTPDADFNGADSFTYTVEDDLGSTSNAATVTVTVDPVNDAPGFTATDPPAVAENSGPQTVGGWATFVANASNPGDEAGQAALGYSVSNVSNPGLFSAGPSVAANGTLTYTPAADATGSSDFEVTVQDDGGTANGGQDTSAPQTFTITVTVDPPPVAEDDTDSTDEETPVVIDVLGNDTDNGSLVPASVTVTSGPTNGGTSVNTTTGAITYTPDDDFSGQDSFTYTVEDDLGNTSNAATVTVTIDPVNDAPGFTAADPPAVDEDSGPQTVNGWATFDPDASDPGDPGEAGQTALGYSVSNVSNPGLFSAGPSVAANGTLTYTPAADATGSSTFEVTVQDDGGTANGGQDTSAPQTFTVTVNPVNDPPVFTSTPLESASQDQPYSYTATAEDVDGDALTLSAPTLPSWLTFQDHGDGTGTLSGTPGAGEIGDHDVVLEASDGVATAQQSFTITVADNLPPVANDDAATMDEDDTVEIDVLANDTDPEDDALDPSTVIVTSGPTNGGTSVNPTTGAITYTPDADFSGQDSFTYTVEDVNGATSNAATVTITVQPENDPPVAHDDAASTLEDDPVTMDVLNNDTDPEGDALDPSSVTVTSGPANGSTDINTTTGAITYTPHADFNGQDSFTYTVDDDKGATSNAATVTVTVEPVEDAPTFEGTPPPPTTAMIGVPYSYTVEADDPDGDPVTLSAPTLPSWLSFTDNGDGTGLLEGTPSAEDVGAHDVVLEASDDGPGRASKVAASTQLAFTIVVIGETLETVDDEADVNEDDTVEIDVLANDAGGMVLSSVTVAMPPAHGTAQPDAATGRITYAPATDFFGTDTFTYTVENGAGAVSSETTVTVTVHPVNDPPVLPADPVITAPEDGSSVLIGGGPGEPPADPDAAFLVAWKPFTDVDDEDSALTYTWELSLTEAFAEPLQQVAVGTGTSLTSTLGEMAALLSSHGVDLYDDVTVYHRVTASDGDAHTVSAAYSVTLTRGTLTDVQESGDMPEGFALHSNYPNPFNPVTVIEYAVPEAAFVTIRVYNALGEEVATLVAAHVAPGRYQVHFDASGLASGTYLYRLQADGFVQVRRMLLVK